MAIQTLEQAAKVIEEMSQKMLALEKQNQELGSLKGKMGREMGELKAAIMKQQHPYSEPKGFENMTEDEANKIVGEFSKNPKKVLYNLFNEYVDPLIKRVEKSENMLNYFGVTEKHPEFRDKAFQDKVDAFRAQYKEQTGLDLGTMEAIERIKYTEKEVALTEKEKKLASGEINLTKEGQFGDKLGGGAAPGQIDGGNKSPQDIVKESIIAHINSTDGAAF